jgi:RNA polymerase sigma factor (sigma-70 family)
MPVEFPATRWSLIARLPDQPQQAGALLALYADTIGAWLAMKLRGEHPERIQDVVQEVLVDLLGKPEVLARANPAEGSKFRYYLLNLAWCSARNALRRERRQDGAMPLLNHEAPAAVEHSDMDRAWAIGVIHQALDELAGQARQAGAEAMAQHVLLHRSLVEGLGIRDIARNTGIPLATASRHLAAGRRKLQAAIADRLRLSGDLAPGADPLQAGALLLDSLGT